MILVHLPKSWPDVLAGTRAAADITLGEWHNIGDDAIDQYGDAILGIYKNEVVTAYDITGYTRNPTDDRVIFTGTQSTTWDHLIGQPNPGKRWVRGQSRPIQYLDTTTLTGGTVEPETADGGTIRAIVGDFTCTLNDNGSITVIAPPGSRVHVINKAA